MVVAVVLLVRVPAARVRRRVFVVVGVAGRRVVGAVGCGGGAAAGQWRGAGATAAVVVCWVSVVVSDGVARVILARIARIVAAWVIRGHYE
jgi:hypothetical protein